MKNVLLNYVVLDMNCINGGDPISKPILNKNKNVCVTFDEYEQEFGANSYK